MLQVFLKPEGRRLNLLVRAPLTAIRDVTFPERGGGIPGHGARAAAAGGCGAQWIADFVELYENDAPLTKKPRVVGARISLGSDRSFDSYEQATAHITGPKLAARRECGLGTNDAGRLARVPDRIGPLGVFDPARVGAARAARRHGAAVPAGGRDGARLRTAWAIRGWCGSIRGGIRRRGASSRWGSTTSWTGPITCCSSSAW